MGRIGAAPCLAHHRDSASPSTTVCGSWFPTVEDDCRHAVTRARHDARHAGVVRLRARNQRAVAVEDDDCTGADFISLIRMFGYIKLLGHVPAGQDQIARDDHVPLELASRITSPEDSGTSIREVESGNCSLSWPVCMTLDAIPFVFTFTHDGGCRAMRFSVDAEPCLTYAAHPRSLGFATDTEPTARLAEYAMPRRAFTDNCR
ncbi:hypothetical protein [Streptomyces sp. NPDC041003]|uniref:hypothetical protein n=1 Tax=Streptomyces sp. NPDC041003 TaxID=3155730 RepID=UPI0033CE223D